MESLTPTAHRAIVPDMFFIVERAAGMETQCFEASLRCLRSEAKGTRFSSIRKSTDIDLGEKSIDGLPVAGTRQTEVPEPSQSGFSSNSEFW